MLMTIHFHWDWIDSNTYKFDVKLVKFVSDEIDKLLSKNTSLL
jgi:hypothetical protein